MHKLDLRSAEADCDVFETFVACEIVRRQPRSE
jgi:hypothetical protein